MKKYWFIPLLVLSLLWAASPAPVGAQGDLPPEEAGTGIVLGKIINQNNGNLVTESLDVMLHIWDQQYVDLGMEHGQSEADGTFKFSGIKFDPERKYAVMAIFENVTYFSEVVPGPAESKELELTVPVLETTSDLTSVQVDQMHLLFEFAEDGMETSEIYILSNLGDHTVKDAIALDNGLAASLRFPLPEDADFIFFQPNEQDHFIKYPGSFVDAYPLLPGEGSEQFMVQYLVPFSSGREYAYTAPVNVKMINFLLPTDSGVSLEGDGLSGPQPYTLQSGVTYQLYSFENISAGETVQVVFKGKPLVASTSGTNNNPTLPLALGGVILGLTMAGVGFWWWRRPDKTPFEVETLAAHHKDPTLDELIDEIARLDEKHDQGLIEPEKHQRLRKEFMGQVKELMESQN